LFHDLGIKGAVKPRFGYFNFKAFSIIARLSSLVKLYFY